MREKEVIVLDADTAQNQNLCVLLSDNNYAAVPIDSLANMDRYVAETDCRAMIVNLDNMSVNNRILRDWKRKKPSINIIALSKRQFHPELEESLREYIAVCLAEPVDTDELDFWLKSVFENNGALDEQDTDSRH